MVEIISNTVEKARLMKPEIPLIAENSICICDEILLEIIL